jgi:hypothetical protein
MMADKGKPRIFLCHAKEDMPRVKELYHQLKGAGYHPWLDKEDLLPGQDWEREIEKIIRNPYNMVVVCLSRQSTTKRGVVQKEIRWALDVLDEMPEDTIYLIPARLEPCQAPDRLRKLHWVDLFEPDGFELLKRSLDLEIRRRQAPAESGPELIELDRTSNQSDFVVACFGANLLDLEDLPSDAPQGYEELCAWLETGLFDWLKMAFRQSVLVESADNGETLSVRVAL